MSFPEWEGWWVNAAAKQGEVQGFRRLLPQQALPRRQRPHQLFRSRSWSWRDEHTWLAVAPTTLHRQWQSIATLDAGSGPNVRFCQHAKGGDRDVEISNTVWVVSLQCSTQGVVLAF